MDIEAKVYSRKRVDFSRLKAYGFSEKNEKYCYETDFMNGDFRAIITIDCEGQVSGIVMDLMNNEVYIPLRNPAQNGAYVNSVRAAYENLLEDIASHCFTDVLFASNQGNRIAEMIDMRYGHKPDFPWEEKPHRTSAVFRHEDTQKWYGLLMNVKKSVVDKGTDDSMIDVLNVKIQPEQGEILRKEEGIFQGYHMNHKYWISILLNETVADERIMELIENSYRLTDKKRK